jgi:hypothetical protein
MSDALYWLISGMDFAVGFAVGRWLLGLLGIGLSIIATAVAALTGAFEATGRTTRSACCSGHLKATLHRSGRWRLAFTKEHVERGSPFVPVGGDRAFEKWLRPPELAPGLTVAFRVFVPGEDVVTPRRD